MIYQNDKITYENYLNILKEGDGELIKMGDRYVVYKNLFNENIRKRLKNKNKIFKLNLNGKKDLIIKVVFIIIYTLIIGFFEVFKL